MRTGTTPVAFLTEAVTATGPQNRSSTMLHAPLRFEPYLRPMVWGGRALAELLGKRLHSSEPYGESWELSDHPHHRSVVAAGPAQGRTICQLMEEHRPALFGQAADQHTQFPWLVKFLDACDWLSVQVHPDEHSVRHLWPGEGSKTEAWFVIDAKPGSRIYAGLLPGVDDERFRKAIASGAVVDYLHSFEPRPGDCVFLPAGTVHALGGGVLLAEVQQTSDATFRVFDWNRKDAQGKSRQLHVEQALACIDWKRGPVEPVRVEGFGAAGVPPRKLLVECPYFRLEYLQSDEPIRCGGNGCLQMLIVLRGEGQWDTGNAIRAGEVWLLPASMPEMMCRPRGTLSALWCTLP